MLAKYSRDRGHVHRAIGSAANASAMVAIAAPSSAAAMVLTRGGSKRFSQTACALKRRSLCRH